MKKCSLYFRPAGGPIPNFKELIGYRGAGFEGDEKPKGDPWKSKFFLLRGVNERGLRGVRSQEPSKTLSPTSTNFKNAN